jgi:hypothetical protein
MQNDDEKIASSQDENERQALIQKILASSRFEKTTRMRDIFIYLSKNSRRFVSRNELALEVYKATASDTQLSVANNAGERCDALKDALDWFSEGPGANETWRCELPGGIRGEGYRLRFTKRQRTSSAVEMFWEAHSNSRKEISVICDPLLFFYDQERGSLFRFVDTNIDQPDREEALSELKRLHRDAFKPGLVSGHFYIDTGAVLAAERLREWFVQSGKSPLPFQLSRDVSNKQLLTSSPIFIGTSRTNAFTKRFFGSPESSMLAYRLHPSQFYSITVANPTPEEVKVLGKLGMRAEKRTGILHMRSPEVTLGIVSRIVNPGGSGVMTFLASDATFNVAQMAATLTDEQQMKRIFAHTGWPLDEPVPECFELMFLVRLWPGNLEDVAGQAELIAWRRPSTEKLTMSTGRSG